MASVCIKPYAVELAARILEGIGRRRRDDDRFPARRAYHRGRRSSSRGRPWPTGRPSWTWSSTSARPSRGEWAAVKSDIDAVTKAAHDGGAIVKVIFENCYLNDDQKIRLCQICGEVGADYVKTSTGYGTGGATFDDLRLMRRVSPPHVKLKAAGGIRTLDVMIECAEIGCDRIGASRTAEILDELKAAARSAPIHGIPARDRSHRRRDY